MSKKLAGVSAATATLSPLGSGLSALATMAPPNSKPDYFGIPNWALSPLPAITTSGTLTGGIRKFVNTLPGICGVSPWMGAAGTNELGQCIPLATPDTTSFSGSDFYRIRLQTYSRQLHADLPVTNLRGYVQLDPRGSGNPVGANQYLGPLILATRSRPVRVLFQNSIASDLNIPTDTTYMGAGMVRDGTNSAMASQKRGTLHLHGGNTPWISDGTTHQWITPAGGDGQPPVPGFAKGVSFQNVPDMVGTATSPIPSPSITDGLATFYWPNQQSGRLMFYHDHAYGMTRLDVYMGEAAGYLLVDPAQESGLATATVPGTIVTSPGTGAIVSADLAHMIPLVIQDKTFVPDGPTPANPTGAGTSLAAEDPTWDVTHYGSMGSLWFPHVYMPNQNPADPETGANPFGRWDYGPWFWPPQDPSTFVPDGLPYPCTSVAYPGVTVTCPGTPLPSGTPEAFMDTPVVNGTAYPKITVDPAAYRFQILSAGNDRSLNLQLYVADPLSVAVTNAGSGYTTAPTVTFTPAGAIATATISTGSVSAVTMVTGGAGYSSTPLVTFTGGAGSGAAATAVVSAGAITGFVVTNGGAGYTAAPTVTISDASGTGATAIATITPAGVVTSITVTNPGSYTAPPAVALSAPPAGGTQAYAVASVNTEVKMVPAVAPTASSPLQPCSTPTQAGITGLAVATLDSAGNPINGTGLPGNCWPSTWPTDGRDGGVPDPTTAGPPMIQIGTEGSLLPHEVVIPSTPVNYEYNRRSITVLNVSTHGLLLGPAERADVIIDFSRFAGKTVILYNDSPAPIPGIDPRGDYYTGDPDYSPTGGAPASMPGYGPNSRTIMQIQVGVSGTANNPGFSLSTLHAAMPGLFAATQDQIIVLEPGYPAANGGSATPTYVRIQDTSISPSGGALTSLTLTSGGSGYSAAPTVTIAPPTGLGTTATATATLAPAPVAGLALTNGGSGYSSAPAVSLTGGGGGTGAAATATLAPVGVASVAVTSGGSGYSSAPTVSFTGGGGTGAAATATLAPVSVASVAVTSGGSGYSSAPTVSFTGGGGTGAAATAALTPAGVASVTLTTGGAYTAAPAVNFAGGGGTGAAGTATLALSHVASVTPTSGGSGYTSAPTVTITGGGGSGAAATATLGSMSVALVTLTSGGSGYATVPTVGFSGGGGAGAAATAVLAPTAVFNIKLTNGGSGYNSPPTVTISAPTTPGGVTATAVASIQMGGQGKVANIKVINQGSGYTTLPTVTITGGGGAGANAIATLKPTSVAGVNVTSGGSGYTSAPAVTFTGGGGTGAAAIATIAGAVASLTLTSGGSGYSAAPTVTISSPTLIGGTTAAAIATLAAAPIASVTVTSGGSGYTSAPAVSFTGGAGGGAAAIAMLAPVSVASVTVTNGGSGYTSAPTVSFTGGGGTGAAATATLAAAVASVTVTSGGSGYTSAPIVSFTGGGGTGAAATATLTPAAVASLTLTSGGSGYTAAPTVSFTGGGGAGAAATATLTPTAVASLTLTNRGSGYTAAPAVSFLGGGGAGAAAVAALGGVVPLQRKAIQELFTLDYGRMNATLGVELAFTNFLTQTTIPYGYVDPPTEIFKEGETQIWKITHNGVDTHFIHFHLVTVQVINRVGWDGAVKPPDPNELSWKDTVRMNPLEDIIVAMRPVQQTLPWALPNSIRPMDPTMPVGAASPNQFTDIDPTNQPATVINESINFGWEYVWHCHILGHEENDMMRALIMAVPPPAPRNVNAAVPTGKTAVNVTWTDNSVNETGFTVQRATLAAGPWNTVASVPSTTGPATGTPYRYTDTTVTRGTTYYYQVIANNVVGYTQTYAAAAGYPNVSADSAPGTSNAVTP